MRTGFRPPDPFYSLEEWQQAHNLDIEGMGSLELYKQEIRAKVALATTGGNNQGEIYLEPGRSIDPETWLLRRIAAIRKERQRREGAKQRGYR